MPNLFGALDIKDSERPFTSVEGRAVIWDETTRIFQRWNDDLDDALNLFVQGTTEKHIERYYLPAGGESQEEGFGGNEVGETKSDGSWDVAFPIHQFGDALSFNDVALGYLTMGQYESYVLTILNKNNNTTFRLVLSALMRNASRQWKDRIHGTLTLQPLANQDGTLYPPKFGEVAEGQENFYLAPNYTQAQISNVNNPFTLIRSRLEPRFGYPEGGAPITALVHPDAVPQIRLLATFDPVQWHNVQPGHHTAVPINTGLARTPAGGRVIGVCDGVTIVEWPRMPSGWIIGLHDDAPPPLKRRVDPADTGLPTGLHLVRKTEHHPFEKSRWRHRHGYAVGNRLGALCIALNGTTNYTVPAIYQ